MNTTLLIMAVVAVAVVVGRSLLSGPISLKVRKKLTWPVSVPVLDAGQAFSLVGTLPQEAVLGGVFSLAPASAQLPAGVTLSPLGILAVADTADTSQTDGVIFQYVEPSV